MPTRCVSRFFLLAAILWLGCVPALHALTSPSKTRVWGSDQVAPGRFCSANSEALENAPGCEACSYETASDRPQWLNRDPIGERGGINLYRFASNDPVNQIDPLGLEITYFYGDESEVFPDGGVPYLGGDTYPEQFVAALYNTIPLVNNALSRLPSWANQFASWATGDPQVGGGVQNLVCLGTLRNPVRGTRPPNLTPPGAGRTGGLREALRRNGVPTSQQPSRVRPNVDRRGNPQPGRTYEYDVPAPGGGTRTVTIRDDSAGHYYGPGNPQNRGPHFNDEAGNHYDY